ncbi:MAG: hypothetical protein ABIQ27_02945 [Flavobacterium sp.]|uniref:hypothetical protein n=1 Tax=Flavobacterium sp. TaxID=239 RepID=UPI003264495B
MRAQLLLFICLISVPSAAQHCGWDSLHLIVVNVEDEETRQPINGLTLTLTDASRNPYIHKGNTNPSSLLKNYPQKDTLIFSQNLDTNTPRNPKDRIGEIAYSYYFLVVYFNNYQNIRKKAGDQIKIEDPTGKYRTRFIPLEPINIISLCGDYDNGTYMDKEIKTSLQWPFAFSPLTVIGKIADPIQIVQLESGSEYSGDSFFVSYYVNKDNVTVPAFFKKSATYCTVYELLADYNFGEIKMEDNDHYLAINSSHMFGSSNHSENSSNLCIVDLKQMSSVTFSTSYNEENWNEDSPLDKESCVCDIFIKNNQLHVKRTVSANFSYDLYEYIETGIYDIQNGAITRVKNSPLPVKINPKKKGNKTKK